MIQQLDLFGSHVTIVASSGETIALHAGMCDCGETLSIAEYSHTVYRGSSYRQDALDRVGIQYALAVDSYGNFQLTWGETYCDACESVCDSCNDVCGPDRDSYSRCENCESCNECCECFYVECCNRHVDDSYVCSDSVSDDCDNAHCQRCCDCVRCNSCGYVREIVCDNDSCERCCERYCSHECECGDSDCYECGEQDRDSLAESVTSIGQTFDPSTLFATGRAFGVELEVNGINRRDAAAVVRSVGLSCHTEDYTHSHIDIWKAVTDATVGGCEVVSPILRGEHGLEQLRLVMTALRANGATVDARCGTHVHHDMTGANGKELAAVLKLYRESQLAIDLLHAPSRVDGNSSNRGYVANVREDQIATLEHCETDADTRGASASFHRYYNVNANSFHKYGTLEFRQHAGTLDFQKLKSWILFGQSLITLALSNAAYPSSHLPALLARLESVGLAKDASAYLATRAGSEVDA